MAVGEHDGRRRGSHIGRSDLEMNQYRLFKIFPSVLVLFAGPYLGRDQGRKTSASDVAHLV